MQTFKIEVQDLKVTPELIGALLRDYFQLTAKDAIRLKMKPFMPTISVIEEK